MAKTNVICVFDNFSQVASRDDNDSKWITAKPFNLNGHRDTWFCLMYRPNSLGLYIEPLDAGPHATITATVTVSVKGDKRNPTAIDRTEVNICTFKHKKMDGQGWPSYFNQDNLSSFIIDNKLTVECEIEVLSTEANLDSYRDRFTFFDWSINSIKTELVKLRNNQNYECTSPAFSLNGSNDLKLKLVIKGDDKFCGIRVVPAQLQSANVNMSYLIWIEDKYSGVRIPTWNKDFTFDFEDACGTCDTKFFSFTQILQTDCPFIKYNTLQIHCQVYHDFDTISYGNSPSCFIQSEDDTVSLSNNEDDNITEATDVENVELTPFEFDMDSSSFSDPIDVMPQEVKEKSSSKFSMQELGEEIRKLDQKKKTEDLINSETWKVPKNLDDIWKDSTDILPNMYSKICASIYVALKDADMLKEPKSTGLFDVPTSQSAYNFNASPSFFAPTHQCDFVENYYTQPAPTNQAYYLPSVVNKKTTGFPISTICSGQKLQRATPYSQTNVPQKPMVEQLIQTQEEREYFAKMKAEKIKKIEEPSSEEPSSEEPSSEESSNEESSSEESSNEEWSSEESSSEESSSEEVSKIEDKKPFEIRVKEGKNHLCEIRCGDNVYSLKTVELASKSEMFKRVVFEKNPAVDEMIVIQINGRIPIIVAEFVRYLKEGTVGSSYFVCREFSSLANEFEIPALKKICTNKLIKLLSIGNVCHLSTLAFKNEMQELANKAIRFAAKHKTEIQETIGWTELCEDDSVLGQEVRATINKVYEMYNKQ